VSIPVELIPATRSSNVHLRMLGPDGQPLARRYVCSRDRKPLSDGELVRALPLEGDQLVPISDQELERLAPEESRDILLQRFVPCQALAPLYFERGFFLVPPRDAARAYHLLVETMERSRRAGLATFVMRGKQHLVALLAEGGLLRAEILRFADAVRAPEELGIVPPGHASRALVQRLRRSIAPRVSRSFPASALHDRGRERLEALIARKLARHQDLVPAADPDGAPESDDTLDNVVDIMSFLKEQLDARLRETAAGRDTAPPRALAARTRKPPRRAPDRERATGAGPAAADLPGDAALAQLSRDELYERARKLGIPGRARMKRAELLTALRGAS
jgi:DNA end-binding protein Ku